jgi:chaperonin cofactor prefoldin
MTLDLVFGGKTFPVPKRAVFELFEHHRLPLEATTYAVQSSVPVAIFEAFANSLKTQSKISVTKENAAPLSLLAQEFFLPDLAAECATLSVPVDQFSRLSDRLCKLELQVSSVSRPPRKIEEKIESQEEALENLRQEVERQGESIGSKVAVVVSRVDELEREFEKMRGEIKAVKDSSAAEIGKLKSVPGLETLRSEFDVVRLALERLQLDFARIVPSEPGGSPGLATVPISPTTVPPVQQPTRNPPSSPDPGRARAGVDCPMKAAFPLLRTGSMSKDQRDAIMREIRKSLDGIIFYLTTKHGGNVHEKGIVTITSMSVRDGISYAVQNIANLTSNESFASKEAPGQWICWDFREMRVRPTHYAIWTQFLDSWVVEGSLDGTSWTEIDRRTGSRDFEGGYQSANSFVVSKSDEFRFIRLTQTGSNSSGRHRLLLVSVEFFGTLYE